jgi:hypothetical protein
MVRTAMVALAAVWLTYSALNPVVRVFERDGRITTYRGVAIQTPLGCAAADSTGLHWHPGCSYITHPIGGPNPR